MSRGYIRALLGVGKSESDLNWYKRFWGKFVWKYEFEMKMFLGVFYVILVVAFLRDFFDDLSKSFLEYMILIVLGLVTFVFFHLTLGGKWKNSLLEYRFEQVMKRAKSLSQTKEITIYPNAIKRLFF